MKVENCVMASPQVHLRFGNELPASKAAECPLDSQQIQACCREALMSQSRQSFAGVDTIELSLQLLDSQAMQTLNEQYRGKSQPTNVLSFESEMPVLHHETAGSLHMLGDLVLCPDVLVKEAGEQGKACDQHWAHMLVHGTLHLCGYDHVDPDEARIMENLEIQILSVFNYPDPYQLQTLQ